MVLDFKAFKKNSSNSLDKLTKQIQEMSPNIRGDDDDKNFWKPTLDKAGNGFAIIRFLPAAFEDVNFVKIKSYSFKHPATGRYYIELSPKSIGLNDPVFDYNGKMWGSGNEDLKEQVKKRSMKTTYISNIQVIKDKENPEAEGKVFKYRYGKKIFDKITLATNPLYEDDPRFDPFNVWSGADFKLKIRKVDDFPNYDLSEFVDPGVIKNINGKPMSDEEIEVLLNQTFKLQEHLDPSKFKSYEDLKKRLDYVLDLGNGDQPSKSASLPTAEAKPAKQKEADPTPTTEATGDLPEEDEDTLKFLQGLMEDADDE